MIKMSILLLTGTGAFRFYIQPIMALVKGIKAGQNDAFANHPPLMTKLLTRRETSATMKMVLKDIFPVLLIGLLLDFYAQWALFHHINIALTVAIIFFIVLFPYFVSRDVTVRLYRAFR